MRRWVTFLSAVCCFLLASSAAFAVTGAPKGWSKIGKPSAVSVYQMDFYDSAHGVAYFYNVGLKKTSDGGKTWKSLSKLPADFALRDLVMASSKVGYIVGMRYSTSGCFLFSTEDGGKTWTDRSSQFGAGGQLWRVVATDASHAWVIGDGMTIFATADGGKTWGRQKGSNYDTFSQLTSVYFMDSQRGWAVGKRAALIDWDVVVYRTSDGGGTWSETSFASKTVPSAIGFSDSKHGWIGGYDPTTFYETSDGGVTWKPKTATGMGGSPVRFAFVSATKGWLVNQSLWQTTDGGTKWTPYLTKSIVYNLDAPSKTRAFAFAMVPGGKFQLYGWKK